MAFDPDAFLAAPPPAAAAAPGGFDPDAFLASTPQAPGPEKFSTLEALNKGGFQGATFGFGDELAGAIKSVIGGTSYASERDKFRAENKAAEEEHPFAYGGGELAAGIATPVPGAGAIKGAGIAAKAAHAALGAGIAGLGASEADLTKGDFHGAINDTIRSALVGGAIGGAFGAAGKLVSKAGEKADDLTIKALAGGESKTSGAAWSKTRKLVNNPETKNILREPVQIEDDAGRAVTTTLEESAGKPPDVVRDIAKAQATKIGEELKPIYERADAKNGGVKLSDYMAHLDEQIKATSSMAPAEAKVYRNALGDMKKNALEQWGHPDLGAALGSQEAQNPAVRQAILKSLDTKVPSSAVRAEATAMQAMGSDAIDRLNPGLQTQVKRDMGNMVRDFVNEHVMTTLGPQDHTALTSLNKRMNAWLSIGTVAEARAEKEAAGRLSGHGGIGEMLGHGSMLGGLVGTAMGHPAALLAPLGAKVLRQAPAMMRGTARAAARVDARLKAVADAAKAGNPWAQKMLATIQGAPGGVARLAALQQSGNQPGITTDAIPPAPRQ